MHAVTLPPLREPSVIRKDSDIVNPLFDRFDSGVIHLDAAGVRLMVRLSDPPDQLDAAQGNAQKPATAAPDDKPKERQTVWEKLFRRSLLSKRLQKAFTENWKIEARPREIESLLTDDKEGLRRYFLDGMNSRHYQELRAQFGVGFRNRRGEIRDADFTELSEFATDLTEKYHTLMENRRLIRRYFAGVFRDGRIDLRDLTSIGNSMWLSPFEAPRFRSVAATLHSRFSIPDHVIGPMLASVGDSPALLQVISRKSAPEEFSRLLNRISPIGSENSANAFAPTLQLLVLAQGRRIPFETVDKFVEDLRLQPKDFSPFSVIVYGLGPLRLTHEIKCRTFASYLRRVMDEFGPDLNVTSAPPFLLAYAEYKEEPQDLIAFLSDGYLETKAYLKSIGVPIKPSIWSMHRLTVLTEELTPDRKQKVRALVRELSTEVKLADVMFLVEICENEQEVKLLLDKPALLKNTEGLAINRVVERTRRDHKPQLEREIEEANRKGLYAFARYLRNMITKEDKTYTERADLRKLTNIQLSRLNIFHRSLDMPGVLDSFARVAAIDLANDQSEEGGYLAYDRDMAAVYAVPGELGDNRRYKASSLKRARGSIATFHDHIFEDSFAFRFLALRMFRSFFPSNSNKGTFTGPSGWVGASKGDIAAAAASEVPSIIVSKVEYAKTADGRVDRNTLIADFDFLDFDQENGDPLLSDRGVFRLTLRVPGDAKPYEKPSKKALKFKKLQQLTNCPPIG